MHSAEFNLYTHAQVAAVVRRMNVKIPVALGNISRVLLNLIKSLKIFVMCKV